MTADPAPSLSKTGIRFGEGDLPLEDVPCYLCRSKNGSEIVDDPPFKVMRCRDCEMVYVTPRVPDSHLHLIYQTEYFKSSSASDFGYTDYTRDKPGYLRSFRRKAKMVRKWKDSGLLLEVGSAAGFFLKAMSEEGFVAHGVEVSPYVCEFARKELGLEHVFNGLLKDAPYSKGVYDVVALWDVIEHVPDPIAELKLIREFMKDDAILVMQTQDIDTWFARLLGSKWQHFKQLEHIHHFSPKTIRTVLDRSGFEVMNLTHRGAGKYISVDFFVERMRRYSVVVHHLLRPAHLFGRLFFYLNPGDEMIVIARPKITRGR